MNVNSVDSAPAVNAPAQGTNPTKKRKRTRRKASKASTSSHSDGSNQKGNETKNELGASGSTSSSNMKNDESNGRATKRPRISPVQPLAPVRSFRRIEDTPCRYFQQYGWCLRREQNQCPFNHNIASNQPPPICRYFMQGTCNKGEKCPFSHNVQHVACRFHWLGSGCKSTDCKFYHGGDPPATYHNASYGRIPEFLKCLDDVKLRDLLSMARNDKAWVETNVRADIKDEFVQWAKWWEEEQKRLDMLNKGIDDPYEYDAHKDNDTDKNDGLNRDIVRGVGNVLHKTTTEPINSITPSYNVFTTQENISQPMTSPYGYPPMPMSHGNVFQPPSMPTMQMYPPPPQLLPPMYPPPHIPHTDFSLPVPPTTFPISPFNGFVPQNQAFTQPPMYPQLPTPPPIQSLNDMNSIYNRPTGIMDNSTAGTPQSFDVFGTNDTGYRVEEPRDTSRPSVLSPVAPPQPSQQSALHSPQPFPRSHTTNNSIQALLSRLTSRSSVAASSGGRSAEPIKIPEAAPPKQPKQEEKDATVDATVDQEAKQPESTSDTAVPSSETMHESSSKNQSSSKLATLLAEAVEMFGNIK